MPARSIRDRDPHMRTTRITRTRGLAILVALATLLAIAPTSASALTLHRAWSAKVGSSGANGTHRAQHLHERRRHDPLQPEGPPSAGDVRRPDPEWHVFERWHDRRTATLGA